MDAYQLTRPILTHGRRSSEVKLPSRDRGDALAEARRYVNQLPLGTWAGPPSDGVRWNPGAAARELERSLFRAAAAHGVTVGIDDAPTAIAVRLVRCHIIVAPAADAAVILLERLRDGDAAATKPAARLIGYLDHRAATSRRSV